MLPTRYCVGLVLDPVEGKVLLLQRNKEPYAGYYNGVGGKIGEDEEAKDAMIRELKEETGIETYAFIDYLLTITFPDDISLSVYGIIVNPEKIKNEIKLESPEGKLSWEDFNFVLNINNLLLAGDGNLSYFLRVIIAKIRHQMGEWKW